MRTGTSLTPSCRIYKALHVMEYLIKNGDKARAVCELLSDAQKLEEEREFARKNGT